MRRLMYGIFRKRPLPPHIISVASLLDGTARVGDLVEVTGGCSRHPGDRVDLVGGHTAIVNDYKGELYYRIVE